MVYGQFVLQSDWSVVLCMVLYKPVNTMSPEPFCFFCYVYEYNGILAVIDIEWLGHPSPKTRT